MNEKKYRKHLEKIQSRLKNFSAPEAKHDVKQDSRRG